MLARMWGKGREREYSSHYGISVEVPQKDENIFTTEVNYTTLGYTQRALHPTTEKPAHPCSLLF